jgi:pyruvate,orthophosphate dikinase
MRGLEHLQGTSVIVQQMVFGNSGPRSGSGVMFTRDPSTGERTLYLDFLFDAQGEDVVAGRRPVSGATDLAAVLPAVSGELERVARLLERELGDMQDIELTVEDGRLYLLQTRAGKRTRWAALRIAVDLVEEGVLSPEAAHERLAALDLETIRRTRLATPAEPVAKGVPAGLGVAAGRAVFDSRRAEELAAVGEPVVLVREAIETDDLAGMAAAEGVLTATGGRTSHAAVVARELGRVCLVGCRELAIDPESRGAILAGHPLAEGDLLAIDGELGEVYLGPCEVVEERPDALLAKVRSWGESRLVGSVDRRASTSS